MPAGRITGIQMGEVQGDGFAVEEFLHVPLIE